MTWVYLHFSAVLHFFSNTADQLYVVCELLVDAVIGSSLSVKLCWTLADIDPTCCESIVIRGHKGGAEKQAPRPIYQEDA